MRDDKVLTLDRFLYKYPCICPKCGKRGYLYERYKRSHISLRGPYLLVRHRVSSNYDKRKYRLARLNGLDPYTAANHATSTKMKDCYVKGPRPTPNRLRKYESVAPPDYGESGKFSDFPYWEARRLQAGHLGRRGEYLVVSWLQSRNWFAKRSFGSRGVDVFAAKGNRVLLIDVKSSRSKSRSLEPVPKDPFVEAESVRTNIPAVRAAYTEGKTPRFFWYATGREIYPGWFGK